MGLICCATREEDQWQQVHLLANSHQVQFNQQQRQNKNFLEYKERRIFNKKNYSSTNPKDIPNIQYKIHNIQENLILVNRTLVTKEEYDAIKVIEKYCRKYKQRFMQNKEKYLLQKNRFLKFKKFTNNNRNSNNTNDDNNTNTNSNLNQEVMVS